MTSQDRLRVSSAPFGDVDLGYRQLFEWAQNVMTENPLVVGMECDPTLRRCYVRVRGDEKTVTTVWFTVRDRSIHAESYFMPWPQEDVAATFEYLLRASSRFHGVRMVIADEDALYFRGELALESISEVELDRLLGSIYAYSEQCFRSAMSIGFPTFRAQNNG